jgi:hypothetical protein
MPVRLRRGWSRLVTSGGQLILLGVAAHVGTPLAWAVCCGLIAAISAFAWTSALRRARAFADMPTSRVASAAQGYAELQGRGKPMGGEPVRSALTHLPCLWYRYLIERRSDNKWRYEASGESDASFILDDGSGECLIDPEGADVVAARKDVWTQGDRRYTEWLLLENEALYALGQFHTLGSQDLQLDRDADVKALLAEWKREPRELIRRFDVNGDGEIDMREWELARAQARREVDRHHAEARRLPETHLMRRPQGSRPYIISALEPERLARRYHWWSFAHLAIFFGALTGMGYTLGPGA